MVIATFLAIFFCIVGMGVKIISHLKLQNLFSSPESNEAMNEWFAYTLYGVRMSVEDRRNFILEWETQINTLLDRHFGVGLPALPRVREFENSIWLALHSGQWQYRPQRHLTDRAHRFLKKATSMQQEGQFGWVLVVLGFLIQFFVLITTSVQLF